MKHTITIIAFFLWAAVANAQAAAGTNDEVIPTNLRGRATATHLELTWQTGITGASNYWEVQGSADGRTFSTIGLVLGGKENGGVMSFTFKQKSKDIRPTHMYYRVLHVATETSAMASSVVRLSK